MRTYPRRRIVVEAKIQGDDWNAIVDELRHLETQIAMHGDLSKISISGGYSSGHIIKADVEESITHDSWAADNEAYCAALRAQDGGKADE